MSFDMDRDELKEWIREGELDTIWAAYETAVTERDEAMRRTEQEREGHYTDLARQVEARERAEAERDGLKKAVRDARAILDEMLPDAIFMSNAHASTDYGDVSDRGCDLVFNIERCHKALAAVPARRQVGALERLVADLETACADHDGAGGPPLVSTERIRSLVAATVEARAEEAEGELKRALDGEESWRQQMLREHDLKERFRAQRDLLVAALREQLEAEQLWVDDPTAAFEQRAAAFRRETGYVAPGKDVSADLNPSDEYMEQRQVRWREWHDARRAERHERWRRLLDG